MSFSLATNTVGAIAHTNASYVNRTMNKSLERLSSGYKLNKAADDASGMSIADSLRTQSMSLGQAVRNANDAIGIIQIADKAMDEQIKILDTIKVKAIQSAQDGQTFVSRAALQADITRLMEELDNIAATTTFNGKSLLAGAYSNASFQIGAYSHTTIDASIGATSSDKIGQTRFETGKNITTASDTTLTFKAVNGRDDITLESVIISHSVGTGIGALSEIINKNSDALQVRASWSVQSTGLAAVGANAATGNTITDLEINGVKLGTITNVAPEDKDGKIVVAINSLTDQLGIRASTDIRGHLTLTSVDGRGITVRAGSGFDLLGLGLPGETDHANYGRLTLIRNDARDIVAIDQNGGANGTNEGFANSIGFGDDQVAQEVINLRSARGSFSADKASAMGAHTNPNTLLFKQTEVRNPTTGRAVGLSAGVTSFAGAQTVMDVADSAIKSLDKIRSDLGSVQVQLEATVNNISVTKINIQFSESQIRDADFGEETSNFKRGNILAQAGNYALAQSSTVLQNITRLLQ